MIDQFLPQVRSGQILSYYLKKVCSRQASDASPAPFATWPPSPQHPALVPTPFLGHPIQYRKHAFLRIWKIYLFGRTDGQMDGRTDPHLEMRGPAEIGILMHSLTCVVSHLSLHLQKRFKNSCFGALSCSASKAGHLFKCVDFDVTCEPKYTASSVLWSKIKMMRIEIIIQIARKIALYMTAAKTTALTALGNQWGDELSSKEFLT